MIGFLGIGRHRLLRARLSSYIDGELSQAELGSLELHLSGCDECRSELDSLRTVVELVRELPELPLPRSFALAAAPAPVSIGIQFVWPARVAASVAALLLVAVIVSDVIDAGKSPGLLKIEAPQAAPVAGGPEAGDGAPVERAVEVRKEVVVELQKAPETETAATAESAIVKEMKVEAIVEAEAKVEAVEVEAMVEAEGRIQVEVERETEVAASSEPEPALEMAAKAVVEDEGAVIEAAVAEVDVEQTDAGAPPERERRQLASPEGVAEESEVAAAPAVQMAQEEIAALEQAAAPVGAPEPPKLPPQTEVEIVQEEMAALEQAAAAVGAPEPPESSKLPPRTEQEDGFPFRQLEIAAGAALAVLLVAVIWTSRRRRRGRHGL